MQLRALLDVIKIKPLTETEDNSLSVETQNSISSKIIALEEKIRQETMHDVHELFKSSILGYSSSFKKPNSFSVKFSVTIPDESAMQTGWNLTHTLIIEQLNSFQLKSSNASIHKACKALISSIETKQFDSTAFLKLNKLLEQERERIKANLSRSGLNIFDKNKLKVYLATINECIQDTCNNTVVVHTVKKGI
jgi:mRNA-degrading endonuclease RelE of RelBE toxin-antitoxin system